LVTSGIDWTTRHLAACCGPFLTALHMFLARVLWGIVLLGIMGFALMLRVRLRIEDTYGFHVWFRYPATYIMREMTNDTERRVQWVGGLLLVITAVYFLLFVLSALVSRAQVQSCAA
jgi:hypothetical protein